MKYFLITLLFSINQYLLATHEVTMSTKKEEAAIPITEDLMREHGLLNRVLLIYEEIIKRIENTTDFPVAPLAQAVGIIKSFIEDYHEKIEETYLFPIFEKHNKEKRLVKTLLKQHTKGREITAQLQKLLILNTYNKANKKTIKNLLQKFITMYRPHEAREDTILFPQVRSLISEKEFKELGELSEKLEHEIFGENGFENILKKVEDIEKELGIYNLEQFTPVIETKSV